MKCFVGKAVEQGGRKEEENEYLGEVSNVKGEDFFGGN